VELNCKHVWGYISDYIDASLDPETRERIERHLEHCEICSAVLDSTRNILYLTADDRVFTLPIGFSERLHARLNQELAAQGNDPNGRDISP
jgi:anti-sigma factor RsiW